MSNLHAFCILLALGTAWPLSLAAQDQNPVDAGRKALSDDVDYPWYDAEKDGIRRIEVYPPKDLVSRKSRWERKQTNWSLPPGWWTFLEVLGWLVMALALLVFIYLLIRAVGKEGWSFRGSASDESTLHGDIDRIEALPFQLQRPQTDLLAEARRHYEAGRFGDAIIYLYSYQLVQLDRHQFIRLTRGKTNRQYLRELRTRGNLFELLSRSMRTFEDVFFGHHTLERQRFEACWQRLDEFHRHLEQAAA